MRLGARAANTMPSTATSPPSYDRLAVARNLKTELEGLTASPAV
jgi:hypothetical protein